MDVINDIDEGSNELSTSFEIGSALTSLPCSLAMGHETSPYTISELIREARRMSRNAIQGLAFLLTVHFSFSFLMMLDYVLLLPPIFDSYQIIWVLWVICPIMTVSYLWTPHEHDVMKQLPAKNTDHLHDFRRLMKYYFIRLTPAILMCQGIFLV